MCEYCKLEKLENAKNLKRSYVDGGKIAKNMDVGLWYIRTDDGRNYITADLAFKSGETVAETTMEIKYCPFCGRKL